MQTAHAKPMAGQCGRLAGAGACFYSTGDITGSSDEACVENQRVVALVLAGGQGQRMGGPKPFVQFRGVPLVQHVVERLRLIFSQVLIVARDPFWVGLAKGGGAAAVLPSGLLDEGHYGVCAGAGAEDAGNAHLQQGGPIPLRDDASGDNDGVADASALKGVQDTRDELQVRSRKDA